MKFEKYERKGYKKFHMKSPILAFLTGFLTCTDLGDRALLEGLHTYAILIEDDTKRVL